MSDYTTIQGILELFEELDPLTENSRVARSFEELVPMVRREIRYRMNATTLSQHDLDQIQDMIERTVEWKLHEMFIPIYQLLGIPSKTPERPKRQKEHKLENMKPAVRRCHDILIRFLREGPKTIEEMIRYMEGKGYPMLRSNLINVHIKSDARIVELHTGHYLFNPSLSPRKEKKPPQHDWIWDRPVL